MIDLDVEQYVETTSTTTRVGASLLLRSQACKTTTFQSSYFVRIVNLWNYVCKTAPSNSSKLVAYWHALTTAMARTNK